MSVNKKHYDIIDKQPRRKICDFTHKNLKISYKLGFDMIHKKHKILGRVLYL